ncbi:MAG: DUF4373 domain-containing protein [Ruminococcus sp.]|nr:DUF4373 domain-containing protein [Ruminococcus sp.]
MGRQNKADLPYFELDCHMDEKVKLIRAEFGLKGFAVVVMMYQYIYGGDHGYYCKWDDRRLLLFMSDNGLIGESKNLINEVVQACIREDIFSDRLYKEYRILTSSGIQKQYLKATAKREVVNLIKEYLLISVPENRNNVVINSISGERNAISDGRNTQSKSKSKSKTILDIDNNIRATEPHGRPEQEYCPSDFERKCVDFIIQSILNDFPNQKVPRTEKEIVKWAVHINRLHRLDGVSETDIWSTLIWTMKDSFWRTNIRSTSKFREKYQTLHLQSKRGDRNPAGNRFNDFEQNKYDFDTLEKELTQNL